MSREEIKEYKNSISFEDRKIKSQEMLLQNSGKYPAILIKAKGSVFKYPIQKLSIEGTMTVGSLLLSLRRFI